MRCARRASIDLLEIKMLFVQFSQACSLWWAPIRSFSATSLSLLCCNSVVTFTFIGVNNDGHRYPLFQFVFMKVRHNFNILLASPQHASGGPPLSSLAPFVCRICQCFCTQKTNAPSSRTTTSFDAFGLTHFSWTWELL